MLRSVRYGLMYDYLVVHRINAVLLFDRVHYFSLFLLRCLMPAWCLCARVRYGANSQCKNAVAGGAHS